MMAGWPVVRIAGVFSLLSASVLVSLIFIGITSGGEGPAALDFGDPALLERLAASGRTGRLLEILALVAPALGLGAGIGWLYVAGKDRGEAQMGVLLWYLGTAFIVAQDALEVAAFETLPPAYLAAGPTTGPAILVLGDLTGNIVHVLTALGTGVGDLGLLLIALALLARRDRVRHFAWAGIGAAICRNVGFWIPALSPLRMLGFALLIVWLVGLGLLMLRRGSAAAAPAGQI
jgi:hypothetical protein